MSARPGEGTARSRRAPARSQPDLTPATGPLLSLHPAPDVAFGSLRLLPFRASVESGPGTPTTNPRVRGEPGNGFETRLLCPAMGCCLHESRTAARLPRTSHRDLGPSQEFEVRPLRDASSTRGGPLLLSTSESGSNCHTLGTPATREPTSQEVGSRRSSSACLHYLQSALITPTCTSP